LADDEQEDEEESDDDVEVFNDVVKRFLFDETMSKFDWRGGFGVGVAFAACFLEMDMLANSSESTTTTTLLLLLLYSSICMSTPVDLFESFVFGVTRFCLSLIVVDFRLLIFFVSQFKISLCTFCLFFSSFFVF
jgi:hypothetical protein